jgi:ATP-dependent Lon protease
MGSTRPERIPLFPLNVVLLPGGDLPLHIFEPRYRRMVQDCIETKSEFGMLAALPKGLVRVGCTAEVLEVAKRYHDGRMDVLTVGRAPFRIVELINTKEYDEGMLLEGTVDYLEDDERAVDTKKHRELVQLYEVCHTIVFGDYPRNVQGLGPDELSYAVAGTLPMDLMWKQQVLELRSEADRQERLVTYLREWAPHLQKIESQRQHAEGNGQSVN